MTYIAMNRFKVEKSHATAFEDMWQKRDSYLDQMPGFVSFHLLRGPERDDHILYSSHTVWASRQDFEAWTRSEAFRKAHARAGDRSQRLFLDHPQFEGFEAVPSISLVAGSGA